MNSSKLTYLLICAVAASLAATGCKKKPTPITPLPGARAGVPGGERPSELPEGGRLGPGEPVSTGGGALAGLEEFEGMLADRAALAAHTVHFDFDSAVVKRSELPHVEAVAAALKADPNVKLLIEGHCDERGTEEYNRALGERRALALREALVKRGITPVRIRTISYGEDRPVDPGHNEEAWAKNRRGEFILLRPK
ncbi:MAG: OmpA family protein [Verrucomicrobiae bacterium]|nr:OmpA family protein [Verrucomicrobiae bacterium]MDW8309387.1 OmpA family protein [Verrucomicrobiales bacterium]